MRKGVLITGFLPASALALAVVFSNSPAEALTISYNDFSDISALELSGDASTIGNPVTSGGKQVLRLTNDLRQSGRAFLKNTVSLASDASFSTMFSFRISNPMGASDVDGQGADGIVFAVQTVSSTAGGDGGGLGYSGIGNSLGVEFDTWDNGATLDQNDGNHVGIDLDGEIKSVKLTHVSTRMNNGGLWYSWVDYDGATNGLEVRLSDTSTRPVAALLSYNVDLVSVLGTPNAYLGFSSGTGAAGGYHDIESWYLNSTYNPIPDAVQTTPVPEPASIVLFGAGLAGLMTAGMRRRKG